MTRAMTFVAGLIFLFAGITTGWSLGHDWQVASIWLEQRWLHLSWFPVLILMGGWMVSGLWPLWAWRIATLSFFGLSGIAGYLWLGGAVHCGCFGDIKVHPAITTCLDITMAVALLCCFPRKEAAPVRRPGLRLGFVLGLWLLITPFLLWRALMFTPASLDPDGNIRGDQQVVLCLSDQWIGKTCPLLRHADNPDLFRSGAREVTVFRRDCPACREHLETMDTELQAKTSTQGIIRGLLEIPSDSSRELPPNLRRLPITRLSTKHRWAMATPTTLLLKDGVVLESREMLLKGLAASVPRSATAVRSWMASSTMPRIRPTFGVHDLGWLPTKGQRQDILVVPIKLDTPQRIQRIISECACMIPITPPDPVVTGPELEIPLIFIATPKPEHYCKNLIISWADPLVSVVQVPVALTIGYPLTLEPRKLELIGGISDLGGTLPFEISNHLDAPIRILYATCDRPGITAVSPGKAIEGHSTANMQVTIAAGSRFTGQAALTITTDSATQSALILPLIIPTGAGDKR